MTATHVFHRMYGHGLDAALLVDSSGRVVAANPSACDLFRRTESEICDAGYSRLLAFASSPEDGFSCMDGKPEDWERVETVFVRGDGRRFWGEVTSLRYSDEFRETRSSVLIIRDISGSKQIEREHEALQLRMQQLRQMDSIGLLVGRVAHDFNNMLGVILARSELVLGQVPADQKVTEHLREILDTANRSVELTNQLLDFSRRKRPVSEVFDLNENVGRVLKMLRCMVGEGIELEWRPGEGVWPIMVVPSQMDQVLTNLCINARDAMDKVGNIRIATRNKTVDSDNRSRYPEAVPGDYVCLSIADDGCGMDGETLPQVFETFFTTKEEGMGTGLGLSTVHGIVEQNGGFIVVHSEPGVGTDFNIYLPRYRAKTEYVEEGELRI